MLRDSERRVVEVRVHEDQCSNVYLVEDTVTPTKVG